jgi:hypothetical protein
MKGRDYMGDLGIHWKITLKWTLNMIEQCTLDHLAQYKGQWWNFFEHGTEPSGPIKGMEFLHQVSDY